MRDQLFIGVDGGGSKSRARVRDAKGRALGEGTAGPGNARLGLPAFEEVMKACRQALTAAGVGEADYGKVEAGFGLAGTAQEVHRQSVFAWPHPFRRIEVCTDAYAAWLGAFEGHDGAILIAGTGSCGLAVVGGKPVEVGGLGAEIGDEGSGMAIGRSAIRKSLWALEGRWPRSPLTDAVLADPHINHSREQAVVWASTAIPGEFAEFAPMVFDHAERGDALAVSLIEEAAADLKRVADRLIALGAPRIAMIGGVFDRILPWMAEELRPRLFKSDHDAADGAIHLIQWGMSGKASTGIRGAQV
jgi:glucosamine kinase